MEPCCRCGGGSPPTDGGNDLTLFQQLQLIQLSRLGAPNGGAGVTGHVEIRSRDVLAILLIFARLIGWEGNVAALVPQVFQEFLSGRG